MEEEDPDIVEVLPELPELKPTIGKERKEQKKIEKIKLEYADIYKVINDGTITGEVISFIQRNTIGGLTTLAYVLDKHKNDCAVIGDFKNTIKYGKIINKSNYTIINDPKNEKFDSMKESKTLDFATDITAVKLSKTTRKLTTIPGKSVKDFFRQISDCKKTFVIIPLTLLNLYKSGGHQNVLIVNTKTKEVEHFEPHGQISFDKDFADELSDFFKKGGYTFITIESTCPTKGVQYYEVKTEGKMKVLKLNDEIEIEYNYQTSGLCVFFSFALVDLRLSNPDTPILILQNRLIKLVSSSGFTMSNFIMKWAEFFKDEYLRSIKKIIDDTLPDGINDYIIGNKSSPKLNPVIGVSMSFKEREEKYYTSDFFDGADDLVYNYLVGTPDKSSLSIGDKQMLLPLIVALLQNQIYDVYRGTTASRKMEESDVKGGSKSAGVVQGVVAGKPSDKWNKKLKTYPPFDIRKIQYVSQSLIKKSDDDVLQKMLDDNKLEHPLARNLTSKAYRKLAENNRDAVVKSLYINPLYRKSKKPAEKASESELKRIDKEIDDIQKKLESDDEKADKIKDSERRSVSDIVFYNEYIENKRPKLLNDLKKLVERRIELKIGVKKVFKTLELALTYHAENVGDIGDGEEDIETLLADVKPIEKPLLKPASKPAPKPASKPAPKPAPKEESQKIKDYRESIKDLEERLRIKDNLLKSKKADADTIDFTQKKRPKIREGTALPEKLLKVLKMDRDETAEKLAEDRRRLDLLLKDKPITYLSKTETDARMKRIKEESSEMMTRGSGKRVRYFPGKKARQARDYLAEGHLAVGDVVREIAPEPVKVAMDVLRPRGGGVGEKETLLKGGAPPQKAFFESAEGAYEPNAPKQLTGNYSLVMDSPTFDAYVNEQSKEVLIAPRGTDPKSLEDLKADASLAFNQLRNSRRYKRDATMMSKLIQQYPPDQYSYFASGHSLSGAVITQMRRDYPFIKMGVAYNSAFQPQDLITQDPTIKRLYTDKDFLYNLGGKFFKNIQVIPMKQEQASGFFGKLKQKLTPSGLQGHSLSNFKPLYGGQCGCEEEEESDEEMEGEPDEIGGGGYGGVKGEGIGSDILKLATGNVKSQDLESHIKKVAKSVKKLKGKGILDSLGKVVKVYKKLADLPNEIKTKHEKIKQDKKLKEEESKKISGGSQETPKKTIDFSKIKWNTLEDLHKRFLKKNPKSDLTDLKTFAKHIVSNKEDFSPKAFRKANFYIHILNPDKKSKKNP